MPLFIALAAHPFAPTTALVGLGAWSLLGTKQALQSLSLMVLIKFLNKGIFPHEENFALVAWATLAAAGLRIIFDSIRYNNNRHPVLGWLWLFAIAVIIQSMLVSQYSSVSMLKIVAFTYTATVILLGFKITASQEVDWTPWFLGLWVTVMVLSLPTLLFPEIGFRTNGTGFQGILSHPQAFAVFMVPAVVWLTGTLLFSSYRSDFWFYLLAPSAWILIYLSEARTAVAAILMSFLVAIVAALWNRPVWRKQIGRAVLKPLNILVAFALLIIVVSQSSLIYDSALSFVFKGEDKQTVATSFEGSRGYLIVDQWQDIKENPILGIGFGVSRDESFKPIFDPVFGLPIGASTEKGFLPTAILQETGIFGTVFFIVLLLSLIGQAFSKTDILLPWVFMSCLFVNLGEMIFFSANGFGLYIWLLMGWAVSSRWENKIAP